MKEEEIENPSREKIEEYLSKIGWSLRPHGCDWWYFYNHKKKCTGMYLLYPKTDPRISLESKNYENPTFTFYLKDCVMGLLDDNCVFFSGKNDKSIFILCPNYDKKKKKCPNCSTDFTGTKLRKCPTCKNKLKLY